MTDIQKRQPSPVPLPCYYFNVQTCEYQVEDLADSCNVGEVFMRADVERLLAATPQPQASAEDVALVAKLVMCNGLYALLTNIQNGISTVIDPTSANRAILKLDKARDAMQRLRASLGVGRE